MVTAEPSEEVASWLEGNAGRVLGLLPTREEVLSAHEESESAREEIADVVGSLLTERDSAREAKDWSRADEIREELSSMGVTVEDGPEGPTWRLD